MNNDNNLTWHNSNLTRQDRYERNKHKSCALWFTGLSGSGKSTLVFTLEKEMHARNMRSYVLDGDNIRHGLNVDLGFSEQDRKENVRRIGEVSKLFVDAGLFVLSAFITPNEKDRLMVRNLFEPEDFLEVYVKCSLEECERRDPKGLYKRARNGEIPNFTGVSAQYDVPVNPDIIVDTENLSIEDSVSLLLTYLEEHDYYSIENKKSN
ncbi:adenylyl-sulfate kinase [Paenibacillus sp. SYP-B3998]|uniref:Adenylyl-sulfate kinase n=1 Tax=Paenibacillus sp. SYP-B3998 TaxID=2678564 RepID=A0A6G3ZZY3_9BACL|nr:adenylyl-sulfate kinase [Paenibacillus sp. SYP-B3998]NEW07139.1 adenylyl-sulfate kinase [Paenibacillus sp. SYP-B3998]